MKKILFILLLSIVLLSTAQNKKNILEKLDKSDMKTSVLCQESPFYNLDDFNTKSNHLYDFYQVYKNIQQGDLLNRFSNLESLKEKSKNSFKTNIIPLVILHSDYETIKNEAFKNGNVSHDNEGFLIRTKTNEPVFNQKRITISSTLRKTKKGLQTTFRLDANSIFNTTNNNLKSVQIDFNDGNGFQQISLNKNIKINYTTPGKKELIFKLLFENQELIQTKSNIDIRYSNQDLNTLFNRTPTNFTATILADLSVYGQVSYPSEGEFEIFLSTEPNATFDKPLIIVDGFDPNDGRPITGFFDAGNNTFVEGIYELFNFTNASNTTENLADLIRAEGFDVVILNFPVYLRAADNKIIDGGVDYIEKNAMLLVELINQINAQKIGSEQNVIIGPSMGGLISRYALNYMENQSLNHDTRLWISFDSPHLGANVPIGFQHQFNYLAYGLNDFWFIGNQNVEELQPIVNGMLKSPAARQMLTDQLEAHITNSDAVTFNSSIVLPTPHPYKNIFYNRLQSLTTSGYPENLRKIAIINGSGAGNPYQDKNGNNILPGREVLNVDIDVTTGTDAELKANFTSYANAQIEVSDVYIDFAWYIPAFDVYSDADSKAFSFSHGIDAASGGLFNITETTASVGTTGIAGEFVTALQTDYFNFIPAVSALGIEFNNNQNNWFYVPNNDVNLTNRTPFDAWYYPTQNEEHVTLTQQNVDFAWNEILYSSPFCSNGLTVWNGTNWSNGNPNINKVAILNGNYDTQNNGNIDACNCIIIPNKTLNIRASNYVNLHKHLINNGSVIIDNQGSFVQEESDATILGLGTYKTNINTTPLQESNRFTYFSSPTESETLNAFSSWANTNTMFQFNNTTQYWEFVTTAENMSKGKGFAIKGATSQTYPFVAATEFNGVFNNGVITQNLLYNVGQQENNAVSDDSNFFGNPYPSAIDAQELLVLNPNANAFYFWTHASGITNGSYGDDYIVWNASGSTNGKSRYIASGQGFFVEANASGTFTFNNSVRVKDNNNDFKNSEEIIPSDKIWLNLTNNENTSHLLIAFSENGTANFDVQYDAHKNSINSAAVSFYSLDQNLEPFAIQTREILSNEQIIPLGFNVLDTENFQFEINIDSLEELNDVEILLKDNYLNIIHDLNISNYLFTVNEIGQYNDRFEILFNKDILAINDQISSNQLLIFSDQNNSLIVKELNGLEIKNIHIYNVIGKELFSKTINDSQTNILLNNVMKGSVLFVQTRLENGQLILSKIVF